MPFVFTCPHCGVKTEVEDRYSGQSGQCFECKQPIELPRFAVGATELPAGGRQATGTDSRKRIAGWMIASGVIVVLVFGLLYAVLQYGGQAINRMSTNRARAMSITNLQKIAAALNAYAANHGSYPPPAVLDENDKPILSWRVLILPYLDEEDLYNQFSLDRPWDDAKNMQAAYGVPAVFRHPDQYVAGAVYEASYYLITGKGTLFPPDGPLGKDSVVDGEDQTILVIEATPTVSSGLWTEPVDLDFASMRGVIGSPSSNEPGGLLDGGAAMVTVDGRGHFLPEGFDPTTFRALVTPRGGEPLRDDALD